MKVTDLAVGRVVLTCSYGCPPVHLTHLVTPCAQPGDAAAQVDVDMDHLTLAVRAHHRGNRHG